MIVELRETNGRSEVCAISAGAGIKANLGIVIHAYYADAELGTMPGRNS